MNNNTNPASNSNKIFMGISASWGRFFIGSVITFVQIPILYLALPSDELGVWFLFLSVQQFVSLSDMGLGAVVARSIAYIYGQSLALSADDQNSKNQANKPTHDILAKLAGVSIADITINSLLSFCVFLVLSLGIAYFLSWQYFLSIGLSTLLLARTFSALGIFIISMFFDLISRLLLNILRGFGDIAWQNGIILFSQTGSFLLIVFLLPRYPDIRTLSMIYITRGLLHIIGALSILWKNHKTHFQVWGSVRFSLIKNLYAQSSPLFVSNLGSFITKEISPIIIGFFAGPEIIPDYNAAKQLVILGSHITKAIPNALRPHAAMSFAAGKIKEVRELYLSSNKITMLIASLWFIGLIIWTPTLMDLWIGPGHFIGYPLLLLLAFFYLAQTHFLSHSHFVWSVGQWPFASWIMGGGIINILLSSVAGYWYGIVGILSGSLIAGLITYQWYGIYYALRIFNVSIREYLKNLIFPMAVFATVTLFVGGALTSISTHIIDLNWTWRNVQGNEIVAMIIGIISTIIFATVVGYKFILDDKEKLFIRKRIERIITTTIN